MKIKKKEDKRKFPCNVTGCCKKLTSAAHLDRHIRSSHTVRDYKCDYCGREFSGRNSKDKLRLHIFQHRKFYRVQCEVCQREYRTNQSMRKHLRTHFEIHQCEECGRTFLHKRLLSNHISAVHKDEQNVPCNCKELMTISLRQSLNHFYPKQIAPDFSLAPLHETLIKRTSTLMRKSTLATSSVPIARSALK